MKDGFPKLPFSHDFLPGQSAEESMEYNCTPSEHDPNTFLSGIPLCCELGISSV